MNIVELESKVREMQLQITREREDYERRIAKGHELLAAANARAEKFKHDFEEAAKFQGLWKGKYERMVALAKRDNTASSDRRAQMQEAQRRAAASGQPQRAF